ncbi:slc10a7 [Symbiodinium sp. CCMP2592]|nr:slc10a7 [Symbiodinium sp. CCMP2592]
MGIFRSTWLYWHDALPPPCARVPQAGGNRSPGTVEDVHQAMLDGIFAAVSHLRTQSRSCQFIRWSRACRYGTQVPREAAANFSECWELGRRVTGMGLPEQLRFRDCTLSGSRALRLAVKPQPLKVDLSTELRVSQALSRRGLALEMAGVCSFQVHEEYSRSLLEHLHRPPPPKFDPPGIDSLLRADREMWIRVSEAVKSNFTAPGQSGAVDAAIQTWQHIMQVAYFLVPAQQLQPSYVQQFSQTTPALLSQNFSSTLSGDHERVALGTERGAGDERCTLRECVATWHSKPSRIWANKTCYSCIHEFETHVCIVLQRFQVLDTTVQKCQLPVQVDAECDLPMFRAGSIAWVTFRVRAVTCHIGDAPTSGHYRSFLLHDDGPYAASVSELWQTRLFDCLLQSTNFPDKTLVSDRCGPGGDPDLDQALWDLTLQECQAGWAVLETGHVEAPSSCVLGRRFAVKQGDKVRPTDDLSISLVNQTLGVAEKIVVHPAACALALALRLQSVCARLSPGSTACSLRGRTFDLKAAYKQLGVNADDLQFCKVAVWDPVNNRRVVLALRALPFKATGSVHRVA